jgi:mono/diheme cytochrome c family protein
MPKTALKWLIVAAVAAGFNSSGLTQDDPGKTAYLSSCAPCHGADAKGSGVFSVELKLKEPPPDLTGLAINRESGGRIRTAASRSQELTEGFDRFDLKEAKAWLEELAS